MSQRKKRELILITIGSFLSYLLFGLFDSLKGSALPALLEDVKLNYSLGGTIIMGQYAGYFAATLLAGLVTDRWGEKAALVLAGISLTLGVAGYSFSSSVLPLLFFICLMGMGLGTLELNGCSLITRIFPENRGRYLNILTTIAGVGAIVSPMMVGALLNQDISWRNVYRYGLVILVPATIYFLSMKYSFQPVSGKTEEGKEGSFLTFLLSKREVLYMCIVNFFYMATEAGIATWLVDFYRKEKLCSIVESSSYLSLFFLGITGGRILGSFFVDRVGHARSVLLAALCAEASILLGVLGPEGMSGLLVLTGLFYSIIFPTATAIMSEIPGAGSGRVMGIYFAWGGLGGMAGPWLSGVVNDVMGLGWGMLINCIFCLGIIIPVIKINNVLK